MSVFEVDVGGVTYDVDAANEEEAVKAAQQYHLSEGAMDRSIEKIDGPAANGVGERIDNTGRSIARGAPIIGSFADEIAAAGDAALSYPFEGLNSILGREFKDEDWRGASKNGASMRDRYVMALRKERAKDEEFDTEHPVASTAGQLLGAGTGGAAMVRMLPGMFAGGSLPITMGKGAGSGAIIAGSHEFGRGEDGFDSRMSHVPEAAAKGFGMGMAMPLLFRGAGDLYTAGKNKLGEMTGLFGTPSKPTNEVVQMLADDGVDQATLNSLDDRFVAMNTSDTAGALGKQIASTPTEAGKKMVQAVEAQRPFLKTDEATDQMTHRALDQSDQIVNAGKGATQKIAADVAQRLGAPATAGSNPGILRAAANLTGILGRGAGDTLTDVGVAVGNAMRAGQMDKNFLEAARLLMTSGPQMANKFAAVAASRAATAEQADLIKQILTSLAPGAIEQVASPMRTGGRF